MEIKLELPLPVSTNHYWQSRAVPVRAGKWVPRVYISKAGKEFRAKVASACRMAGVHGLGLAGRLAVQVELSFADKRRRDLDNYGGKALLDAITNAGVWLDDSQIDLLEVRRVPHSLEGGCVVRICEILEDVA